MWTNALTAMGAAVLGSTVSTTAKALYQDSFVQDAYKEFTKSSTGQWFDTIFSSEGVQGTLKSVSSDLVKQGLGLNPREGIDSSGLNRVISSDTYSSKNKINQAGGRTAKFALGSSDAVRTALLDTNVQGKLAGWVTSSGTVKQQFVTPNIPFSGTKSLKSGVIKRAD